MYLRSRLLALVSLSTLLFTGCGSKTATTPPATPAPTATMTLSPATVAAGATATLNWTTSNATTVSIDQNIGTVAANGSKTVTPAATTTYTLTATGNGSVTAPATLTVTTPPPAPTGALSAAPASIVAGATATLNWTTTNATTVSIDQGIGTVAANGTTTVSPTATTTYTLTVTGAAGTTAATSTATVTVTPATTTATLAASPSTITTGASTTLTWATTNATAVSISPTVGTVAASGSTTISPTTTTTYTITATGAGQPVTATAVVTVNAAPLTGVLEWKGDTTGAGLYGTETSLTPANVNPTTFGKSRDLITDGQNLPQPLYVRAVNLGAAGTHDLIIAANENDSVWAFDGQGPSTTALWHRSFLNAAAGITYQADNHGGRSSFGGAIGITGTPVVDPATGILYVVTATQQTIAGNVVVTDTLHSIDIRTGLDAGAGSVVISASVPGTSEGSVNGQLAFSAPNEDQRPGLKLVNGVLYVAFGSFSDFQPFHGWLFAYDPTALTQLGVFQASPNYRADYDNGGGSAFWNGGAAPSFDTDGTIYIVAGNGSTDVENGGVDYGDTVLHMSFVNGKFTVLDWFTPFNRDCIDASDIEMGSGGFAVLPDTIAPGRKLGAVVTKEGRFYVLDRTDLGHFNMTADDVVAGFMVGAHTCDNTTTGAAAEGGTWNRLYGNASYWNGNFYMVPSNEPVMQFSITGTTVNQTPVAVGATNTYYRGGNTAVSANGNTNGVVWMYEKAATGSAILHAYDATNVSKELWNTTMNSGRDALATGGEGFQVPVIIDGKVLATSGSHIGVFQLIQ